MANVTHIERNGCTENPLRLLVIIKKGRKTEHPSGAICYRHSFGNLVGTWVDGTFRVIRFYPNS